MSTIHLLRTTLASSVLILLMFSGIAYADSKTLQPDPTDGMDRFVTSLYSTSNFSGNSWLWVGGQNSNTFWNSFLRYNLSGMPQVASQVLLYMVPASTGYPLTQINWTLPTTQWRSSTITWSSKPSGLSAGQTVAPTLGYWYSVDITNIYNLWRNASSYQNYGLGMAPAFTANYSDAFVSSASTQYPTYRPKLVINYTPQSTDNIIRLKWHVSSPAYANRTVTQAFGADWAGGTRCPVNGPLKKHNGTDFGGVTAGSAVYAGEDGIIKETTYSTQWGYNVVIESNSPSGGKFTTVYWHVQPVSDVLNNIGAFVPKGMLIATVYNLGTNTHSHLGVRYGSYTANVSGTGALPTTNCVDPSGIWYPAFPAGFIDPNFTGNVIFG